MPIKLRREICFKADKDFEKEKSLYQLKKTIQEKELQKKYFISKYDISLDPWESNI